MPVVWTKEYSIGIDEMDRQHQRLLVLINKVEMISHITSNRADFQEKTMDVLEDLLNYTLLHFASEEVLLRMFEYPEYEEHKKAHDKFVAFVTKKKEHAQSLFDSNQHAKINSELDDLYNFLKKWLLGHIMKTDMQYTDFFLAVTRKAKKSEGFFSFLKK